jgi:polysaccharide export outer membrane protein
LVKLVNKEVTIIGEVRQPGSYTYVKDRINIFEALSLAGDITLNGNRNDVFIIRTINDSIAKIRIDLTNDKMLLNGDFYLRTNDVVYVKPRPSAKWSIITVPITLILSTVTTFLLVYSYIQL